MLKTLARLFGGGPRETGPAASPSVSPPDIDVLLADHRAAIAAGRREEALAGLKALLEAQPDIADAQLMLGTLLHEDGNYQDASDCYLLASAFRPDWWQPHFQLGLLARDRGALADAIVPLTKALELGASDPEAHVVLGAAHYRAGDAQAAALCFRAALVLEPDHAMAHSNLGVVLFRHFEQYEEGERHIARARELAPNDSTVACNLVMVLYGAGRDSEVLDLANRLLERDPALHEVRINRAFTLLRQGRFGGAWTDYEARKQLPEARYMDDLPWPDWDGSALAGRTVYVALEQGIGDEIMFASCLPQVLDAARHCYIECSTKLLPIFRRSFPGVDVLAKDAWRGAAAIAQRPPDCRIAIGSLPRFLRRSRADFPQHTGYLRADPRRVQHWKMKLHSLPGRLKVGISWRGGIALTRRSLRSIPLEDWGLVLSLPGIDFVSLQYGESSGEIEDLRQATGLRVHAWPGAIDDYDETAALVSALDLVVSVQTAVVHLAGALGSAAWALVPSLPEWRYGWEGESMIWYPSVRLIRQGETGQWGPVMESVRADLEAFGRAANA